MRGQAFVEKARSLQLADRHAEKFHMYQSICIVVDKFMRGASEALLPNISIKQFNLLTTYYGITIDPGPRVDVTPLRHKGRRLYAPRPKEYRPGTPLLIQKRYRKKDDRTTAPLRTMDEAREEAGLCASQVHGVDLTKWLSDRGWVIVARFVINPYMESDYVRTR